MKVVTKPGGVIYMGHYGKEPTDDLPAYADITDEQAQQLCDQGNRKAEALGIKTRYEVVES